LYLKAGNSKRTKMSSKYEQLVASREALMEQFSRGEISRTFYLREMGAKKSVTT